MALNLSACRAGVVCGMVRLMLSFPVIAQPVLKLNTVAPDWIQRGTTIEIVITGENLGGVTNLIFNGNSGLQGVLLPKQHPRITVETGAGGITTTQPGDAKRVTASITVAPGTNLRPCELRLVGPDGVSNPLTLNISPWPEIQEKEPNNTPDQAQKIVLPAVLNGRIKTVTETDYYRFQASKGQHLIFDVYAFRMGSPLDSSLAILDASGKELARNEDYNGLDSFLDFLVPQDGEYQVQLRDFRFQGGSDFKYRLLAGELPYVTWQFPLGGQRGRNTTLELQGFNLPPDHNLSLRLETNVPLGPQDIRLDTPRGVSNALLFDVGESPEFNETEPNNQTNQANLVRIPVNINGRLNPDRDVDLFKFKSEKDQRLIIEVKARRFGSPLDSLLTLMDAQGKILQQNDDASGADARIDFDKFKKDQEYYVSLRDLLWHGGEAYVYRLSIHQPAPDFSVKFMPDVVRIRRGGRAVVHCELSAQNGFTETVQIACVDLPPGIFSEPLLLTPSTPASGLMVLSATPEARLGSFPIKLAATSNLNGKSISHPGQPLSNNREVKQAFLTVLELTPFAIEARPLNIVLEQDQTVPLDLLVQRHEGFQSDIKFFVEGFSAGKEPITRSLEIPEATLKPGNLDGKIQLKARLDSEVGTRTVVIRGETIQAGQTMTTYSGPIPVTLTEFPFVLNPTLKRLSVTALPAAVQSAAREAVCEVMVDRRMGFKKEIQLSLDGVPEGITGSIENIPENGNETTLKLVATEKAPVNKQFTLRIAGAGTFNDRTYRQKAAPITLSVTAPAEPAQTVAAHTGSETGK